MVSTTFMVITRGDNSDDLIKMRKADSILYLLFYQQQILCVSQFLNKKDKSKLITVVEGGM